MTEEQKAAYVHAQSVAATAEIESMKILNKEREAEGKAFAYGEDAFLQVIDRYGLNQNTIVNFFQ